MFRVVTNLTTLLLTIFIGLLVSSSVCAQNYLWDSNNNTNWTRNGNWSGDGRPGGTSGYGGTTGRLDFRGNAVANYDPVGQGFGSAVSTFNTGRGLVLANTLNGSLAVLSGEIRLVNSVLSSANSPVMANNGNASLSITGTGRLDSSGNVNDFIFYWAGATTNISTMTVNGSNASFIGNRFNLRQGNGGTGTVNVTNSGTMAVSQIVLTGGTGNNVLNFNGGILRARASNANFFGSTGTNLPNTTVNIQSGGMTVDTGGFNIGIGQSLGTGGGGIAKTGSGQLTLSGANTYTGTTNIQDGILIVNGTHTGGGNYTVGAAAELGGTGSTTSNVSVNGRISAGNPNSIGQLGVGGLQLNSSSRTQLQLDSTTVNADSINVNSTGLSISSGAILELGDLAATIVSAGTKLSLVNYNGAWNGGLWTFQGNSLANNSEIVVGLNRWLFRYNDTSPGINVGGGSYAGFVTVQAIPEAGAAILVGLCIASVAGLSLRRRRPVLQQRQSGKSSPANDVSS